MDNYISINLDTLAVMHKHRYPGVIADLVFIESEDDHTIWMGPESSLTRLILKMTQTEKEIFYRNMTGEEPKKWHVSVFTGILRDGIKSMAPMEANPYHSELQAKYVEMYPGNWKYVDNTSKPCKGQSKLTQFAASGLTENTAPIRQPVIVAAPKPPTVAPTPYKPAPPRGSSKVIIWAKADEMWTEAGKPTDKATVLALRKQMMIELEKDGIKKTTSSTSLGGWQKENIILT